MFDILDELFEKVVLHTSTTKTVTPHLQEVYDNWRQGLITMGKWKRRRVQCEQCGAHLLTESLPTHVENQHGVFRSRVLNGVLTAEEDKLLVIYATYLSQPVDRFIAHIWVTAGT